MKGDAGPDGVFEVLLGIELLGEGLAQERQQGDGVVSVFGAFGDQGAAHVDVGTASLLVGINDVTAAAHSFCSGSLSLVAILPM